MEHCSVDQPSYSGIRVDSLAFALYLSKEVLIVDSQV